MKRMPERIISHEREDALVRLLEDPSPVVQEALQSEFQRLGDVGLAVLQRVLREADVDRRETASRMLEQIAGPDPSRMLMQFIESLQYELETGLFLINRVIFPDLKIQPLKEGLDLLARRCLELRALPMSARGQCNLINRVLFHEAGFRGNVEDYEDPLNSCLEAVFRRRKGIPVTLCCLYILVADRMGLELEPVAVPGHFVVGCFRDRHPFYIDPFEGGKFRSQEEMRALIARLHIQPELHHLAPVPISEVLCRVCRNLVEHFAARGQHRWSNRFRVFVRAFEASRRRRSEA